MLRFWASTVHINTVICAGVFEGEFPLCFVTLHSLLSVELYFQGQHETSNCEGVENI